MIDDGPTHDPDRTSRIERALAEFFRAVDAGAPPDVAAWLDHHADLQPELGELVAAEAGLRRAAEASRTDPGQTTPEAATSGSGERSEVRDRAVTDLTEEATPSPRPAVDAEATTDRVDADEPTVDGDSDVAADYQPARSRVRYIGD
jgi:hypothetical protein